MKEFDIFKNPSPEEYEEITEAVKLNDNYCPCMIDKNEDTKCMCKAFRDSEETDFCHCGRFYKVRNYETIALLGDISSYDSQESFVDWHETLTYQAFAVLAIPLNLYNPLCGTERHFDLCKSIIAKSDAVVVLGHDQRLTSMVRDLIEWAGLIGKKVLTREDLVK